MNDWQFDYVDTINRKVGEISKARGACTEEQLRVLDALVKAVDAFEFEFTETVANGGSANDITIGCFTSMFSALSGYRMHWTQEHLPDFYDEVMAQKRVWAAKEALDAVPDIGPRKKECVSCGTELKGRQKKLCGKKKCKDQYYGKK